MSLGQSRVNFVNSLPEAISQTEYSGVQLNWHTVSPTGSTAQATLPARTDALPPPSLECWGKAGSTDSIPPRFLVWGVRKQWWHAFPYWALEKKHAWYMLEFSQCVLVLLQPSPSRKAENLLYVSGSSHGIVGSPDLGSWVTRFERGHRMSLSQKEDMTSRLHVLLCHCQTLQSRQDAILSSCGLH